MCTRTLRRLPGGLVVVEKFESRTGDVPKQGEEESNALKTEQFLGGNISRLAASEQYWHLLTSFFSSFASARFCHIGIVRHFIASRVLVASASEHLTIHRVSSTSAMTGRGNSFPPEFHHGRHQHRRSLARVEGKPVIRSYVLSRRIML